MREGARARAVARLGRLLALARSPNPHEADSARRAAERLMAEHEISVSEVEGEQRAEVSLGTRGFGADWRFAVATVAARHCGAEAICLVRGRSREVRLVGTLSDVSRARALYENLVSVVRDLGRRAARDYELEVAVISRLEGGSRGFADSFRRGASIGIAWKLGLSREPPPPAASSTPSSRAAPESRGPAEPTAADHKLARVRSDGPRGVDRETEARYHPEERPIHVDDASSPLAMELGRVLARRLVVVGDDGVVGLREAAKKDGS